MAVEEQSGTIYAISSAGDVSVVTSAGEISEKITLEKSEGRLRLANLAGDAAPEFVTLGQWSRGVFACDSDGQQLWDYTLGQGVDDVACYDLDGDGADEVIIGYNGGTGLHVLDNRGELVWKTTSIGNVWHVSAGKFTDETSPQVVTTSATGEVHVFDAEGEPLVSHHVSVYANMVRLVKLANKSAECALVGGSSEGEYLLLADGAGKEIWKTPLPTLDTQHIDSLDADEQSALAAAGMRGGLVHVLDVTSGEIVATVTEQGSAPMVALLSRDGEPTILLVASGRSLSAFALTETAD